MEFSIILSSLSICLSLGCFNDCFLSKKFIALASEPPKRFEGELEILSSSKTEGTFQYLQAKLLFLLSIFSDSIIFRLTSSLVFLVFNWMALGAAEDTVIWLSLLTLIAFTPNSSCLKLCIGVNIFLLDLKIKE
jgi:hypothetical protein